MKKIFLSFLFLFLNTTFLFAFQIPLKPDGYVTDRAHVLSDSARDNIENKLKQFEEKTSNQVVLAIFPSLEGGALEDVSLRLAEQWKIGQKGKDNGILFVIFVNDHKMRIEVGYGLESVLPDALAGEILRREVTPRFRQGEFDEGVMKGVEAILSATAGSYQPTTSTRGSDVGMFIFFLILLIFFPMIMNTLFYVGNRRGITSYRGWGGYGGGGFSGESFGGSSGGGSGFSGGGGGFGGGGASGGW
jgi:uncharacterized protein